jgi:eukaryotic-like serine/threonine-protein kinase
MLMLLGKYSKRFSILVFSSFLVILVSACSNPAPAPGTDTPPTQEVGSSPTETLPAAPASPESIATSTPVEPTHTPQPSFTPTPDYTPTPGIGSARISDIDGMEQLYVPAGEFIMGTDDPAAKQVIENGRAYPEIPEHTVYLDGYWIDKYEVTNAQYGLCVAAGACEPPHSPANYTYSWYYGNPEFSDYPVVWVSWFQARDYCGWAGRRLPTEAEWEKAARGVDGRMYPWGNEPVDGTRANFCDINCTRTHANGNFDDGYPDTAPVGSYPAGASPYGAMDMAGNVWEWTSTLIYPYPYDPDDGREDPDSTWERVWRGGPWSNGVWWMRATVRYRSVDFYKWYVLGLRCATSE